MGWGVILPLGKCLVALEKSLGGPPVNRALSGGSKKREFSMLFESGKFLAGLFFGVTQRAEGTALGVWPNSHAAHWVQDPWATYTEPEPLFSGE